MPTPIKIPDIGTTTDEVTLLKWLKQEGDPVQQGDSLCEIETDKAVTDLESVAGGTLLRQVIAPGTKITVGTVIAYVGNPGDPIPEE